jgi:hypothetical protein
MLRYSAVSMILSDILVAHGGKYEYDSLVVYYAA